MNINSVNNIYNPNQVANQAKLPTGAAAKETVKAFERVITNVAAPMSSTDVSKTMNGISEGISSVEEQLKSDAKAAKDNLKALFNKLSGAEAVKLDEEGFDINDIDDEELVTVVDRIKIMLAAYNENFQAFAGAFDMPEGEAVEEMSGANMAAKVAAKLSEGYMPTTQENVTDVVSTLEMADDVSAHMPLTDEAKAYLIGNEVKPTIENLYMANHSTINNGYQAGLTNDQWQQIKPQVEKIINESNIDKPGKALEDAKWLIVSGLPVTEENLQYKDYLDNLEFEYNETKVMSAAVDNMTGGKKAADVVLQEGEPAWKKAAAAIGVVNATSYENVVNILSANRKLTIQEMADELIRQKGTSSKAAVSVQTSVHVEASVSSYRVLCEARIMMTASSTTSLIQRGIDIYSEDLQNLVDLLHEEETRFIQEQLTKADAGSITEADFAQVANVNDIMAGLKFMPCAAIGSLISTKTSLTITGVHAAAFSMQRQYEEANQSYETMSTKVRSDMGDSIKEAMVNSGSSILSDLGEEVNEINLRAVRILAYNSMEMSTDNLNQVKAVDSILNNLIDNMAPEVTYQMIRDGINPMETDIATLNQYINENYTKQDETVKYSEFLYKLEHTEGISKEDRAQFIGIYKMFHTFKKDAGKAVGALINQNAKVTLKNLMMAVDSRKQYGMNVTLDENAGMSEIVGETAYYQNLFSELAKEITPAALKKASEDGTTPEEMSPEKMAEVFNQYKDYDKEEKEAYFSAMIEDAAEYQDVEESVMRLLTDNDIPVTFYHLMAARELMNNSSFYDKLHGKKNEQIEKAMNGIFDAFEDGDSINEAYDMLEESVKKAGEEVLESSNEDTYLDVRELKNLNKTVELVNSLSRHRQYFIPFATKEGVGSIRLKMVKTPENEGKMEMTFATEELGNVYAKFYVGKERCNGYIVSDRKEGVEKIRKRVDNISQTIKNLGITSVEVGTGFSDEVPAVNLLDEEMGAPSSLIYQAAKEILVKLTQIISN